MTTNVSNLTVHPLCVVTNLRRIRRNLIAGKVQRNCREPHKGFGNNTRQLHIRKVYLTGAGRCTQKVSGDLTGNVVVIQQQFSQSRHSIE